MDSITKESVISTSQASKKVTQFYDRTVVFDFGHGITPIAVTLDYLYAQSDQYVVYDIENYEAGVDNTGINPIYHVLPSYIDTAEHKNQGHNTYKFLNTIREMIFKYGLQHEYYKNRYGKWIDLGTIRPHFAVKNYTDNIFSTFFTGTINDDILESSIYTKVCDHSIFDGSFTDNYFVKLCMVKDVNLIPKAKYFVKDWYSKSAFVYDIERGDGTYTFEECPKLAFTDTEKDAKDSVHSTNSPRFSYKLANADDKTVSLGTYLSNNNHKMNDLLLTFIDNDGNPYVDLSNLFVILNGLIVQYIPGPSDNTIYLKDVVKYAAIQPKTLMSGVNIDDYIVSATTKENGGIEVIKYDIPREKIGFNYKFDIKVYKWDNISVSSFIEPISTGKLLKTVPEEANKSFWLVNKLTFSHKVNKEKSILLCGNTIVDKDSWEVLSDGSIKLTGIEIEFDLLYSEMYPRMREYLATQISHSLSIAPKLEDYLKLHPDTEEGINEAYREYDAAIDEWKNTTGSDNYHYARSAFDIVVEQFRNRTYALIEFDNISERAYDIQVIENRQDIKLNKPAKNYFINENWNVDDIIIMNGICHDFVNKTENVFFAPETWYRHGYDDVFENASGYKLQIIRHDSRKDAFHKLNYIELIYGPKLGTTYYRYDEEKKAYFAVNDLEDKYFEFEKTYRYLSDDEKSLGYDSHKIYFIKENNNYVRANENTDFEPGVNYYVCEFTKDYYVAKK